jgi:FkbM family methyltransferase
MDRRGGRDLRPAEVPVHALTRLRDALRAARAVHSRIVGGTLAAIPALEPAFITTGRWIARRSRLLGTLYWFAQDDLLVRLRRNGNRFRRLPIAGIDLFVDILSGTGRLHYFYDEPYEPELAQAVRRLLRPGDVFLDVGANVGFFSVLAGRIVGESGRVVAFEPHPEALVTLKTAVALNHLTGVVEIVEMAVGSAPGSVRLYLSDDSVLSTTDPARSPARNHFAFDRSIDVRGIRLDDWFAQRPDLTPRIRAIKIDVEGTECDVLEGMPGMLASCPAAAILCETEAGSAADRLLRSRGYEASFLDVRLDTFGNYLYQRPATTAL